MGRVDPGFVEAKAYIIWLIFFFKKTSFLKKEYKL